jgi:hypothetical protein
MSAPGTDVVDSAPEWLTCLCSVNSSLQRIEGHYVTMDKRTSDILERVGAVEIQFAPIVKKQENLDGLLSQLVDRVSAVEQVNGTHHRGSVGGGVVVPRARSFALGSSAGGWMCPICRTGVLMHALSLKGHIRKLLPGNASTRPKCRWKILDQQHVALVSRFDGDTYEERCDAFTRTFYAFLQAATSSSVTEADCALLITAWLTAVLSIDCQPLPELPRCSSSSGSRRQHVTSSDTPSSSH